MEVLSIGDTHGNNVLERVKELVPKYDKIIFVGDYVDSFTLDNITINKNLIDLIEFKKENLDKVILLLGNHDLHYLYDEMIHRCTGYRPEVKFDLQDIFKNNKQLFQLAFQIDNYIWTHAGITTGWYEYRFSKFLKDKEEKPLADQLNLAFDLYEKTLFDVGWRRGGIQDVGGPLWADKIELINNPLKNYHQIVGHTRLENIRTIYKDEHTSITFIDVIENHKKENEQLDKKSFHSIRI